MMMIDHLRSIEHELAGHATFGDCCGILDRAITYYLRGLEAIAGEQPVARQLYEALAEAPSDRLLDTLGDPVVRVTINDMLEAAKQEDHSLSGKSEKLLVSVLEHVRTRVPGLPTMAGISTCSRVSGTIPSITIWDNGTSSSALKQRFEALFADEIATSVSSRRAVLRNLDPTLTEPIDRGHALLVGLLPDLAPSLLAHVRLISIVDTEDQTQWTARSRADLCQNVSTHAIPTTIFLSPTPLQTPWHAAEALLHEAAHKKLSDMVLTRSIFRSGFDTENSPTIRAIWNRSLSWNSADWSIDRALFAFHVYVHLALFFARIAQVENSLFDEFGSSPNSFRHQLEHALDRASYLGRNLAVHADQELGDDGRALVEWLLQVLSRFGHDDGPDRVDLRLLLDRYDGETKEVERLIRLCPDTSSALQDRPVEEATQKWDISRTVDHLIHSELVSAYRALNILGENEPPKFPFYDGDRWSLQVPNNMPFVDRAALFSSLRGFLSSTLRATKPGALDKTYSTSRAKTLRDHLEEMVEHCGRHRHVLERRDCVPYVNRIQVLQQMSEDLKGHFVPWSAAIWEDEPKRRFQELADHLWRGRVGQSWCRHAVKSIKKGRFLVADARRLSMIAGTQTAIESATDLFVGHYPFVDADRSRLDTLTILLNSVVDGKELERTAQRLRSSLLGRGLMLGVLHPGSMLKPLTSGARGEPYRTLGIFATVRWACAEDRVFTSINPRLTALLDSWLARGESVT